MFTDIAKLIFNFNFKLEDEIALLLISPTTHPPDKQVAPPRLSSGTANPTEKVYWQCSTTTFPIEIEWMDLYCNFWI